jgi:hypothetical protein
MKAFKDALYYAALFSSGLFALFIVGCIAVALVGYVGYFAG